MSDLKWLDSTPLEVFVYYVNTGPQDVAKHDRGLVMEIGDGPQD